MKKHTKPNNQTELVDVPDIKKTIEFEKSILKSPEIFIRKSVKMCTNKSRKNLKRL